MATIELKNLCKQFESPHQPGLAAILNPFAAMHLVQQKLQADTSVNPPQQGFAIENLNLTIPDGRTMVVLGPSGCGKSTLLRLIAGLLEPDLGEILYDGVNMQDVPAGQRQIGIIFQNYALYPHWTARTNILSYFRFKKQSPELDEEAQAKFHKTSELLGVDIAYLLDRKPTHLSGGEKQRVALGRCITRNPALFLLDEPFSNLDQQLREKYRVHLRTLLRHFQITTVYVTHDQQEALILADVLAIMNIGCIEQVGTPDEIYNQPSSRFVAEFLNMNPDSPAMNFFDGAVLDESLADLLVGVRPEDISVCHEQSAATVSGTAADVRPNAIKKTTVVCVTLDEHELYIQLPFTRDIAPGDTLPLWFERTHFFDKRTGQRIRTEGT